MTVVGAVDDQGMLQSPGSSSGTDKKMKKAKPVDKPKTHSSKPTKCASEKPANSPMSIPSRSMAHARIDELDQKWSDRFHRLEALLLAKTFDKGSQPFKQLKLHQRTFHQLVL